MSHDILKVKHSERIEELEKCLADLKEERNLETEQDHEEINALRRKVTQLEIALKAAQEDVESQQQLSAELSRYSCVFRIIGRVHHHHRLLCAQILSIKLSILT